MRHTLLLIAIIGIMLAATFVPSVAQPAVQDCTQNWPFTLNNHVFIPLIILDPGTAYTPGSQLLSNGSFEAGWTDVNGSIQQANFWTISWVSPGQLLYDSVEKAWADPEFTHKCNWQLPPHEQPGQPGALILDGITVYKVFHAGASFGGELRQVVTGLPPGLPVQLTVPILVADDNAGDYNSASGVWLNGVGEWKWNQEMGNRIWYYHTVNATVPGNGQLEVLIRMKSKWDGADFFIDAMRLEVLAP